MSLLLADLHIVQNADQSIQLEEIIMDRMHIKNIFLTLYFGFFSVNLLVSWVAGFLCFYQKL